METNFSFGFQSLQNTPQIHHQFYPQQNHPSLQGSYPQQISPIHPLLGNNFTNEDITTDPSLTNFTDPNPKSDKKTPAWHRMKWTSTIVRLLITAVSYIDGDFTSPMLKKKGKWRLISKVLAERGGSLVSPQQCEDKFNDLNKRYKRLTDILGRGRSCKIVENPSLLDCLSDIPDKLKEEARKILGSKHLFYEAMCSYHNCNRVNLPADPNLRKSLHLALGERDFDEGKQSGDTNGEDEGTGKEEAGQVQLSVGERSLVQIREEGLRIEAEMLEIEKQKFKWRRSSKKKERELDRMRLENERMKMENERLEFELRKKELDLMLRHRRNYD